jgi:hypothetical protein
MIKLISLVKRHILFPTIFYPLYVVPDRDGVRLFGGSFVGQLLSMPAVVFGCQTMGILTFLHDHLVVLWVRVEQCGRDRANSGKRRDEGVGRSGGKPCVRL